MRERETRSKEGGSGKEEEEGEEAKSLRSRFSVECRRRDKRSLRGASVARLGKRMRSPADDLARDVRRHLVKYVPNVAVAAAALRDDRYLKV